MWKPRFGNHTYPSVLCVMSIREHASRWMCSRSASEVVCTELEEMNRFLLHSTTKLNHVFEPYISFLWVNKERPQMGMVLRTVISICGPLIE